MSATTTVSPNLREPQLLGQTVVLGGSSGIGLETARRARAEGVALITGRNPEIAAGVSEKLRTLVICCTGSQTFALALGLSFR